MENKKTIIGICGSASQNSLNLNILKWIANTENFNFEIIDNLSELPHFKTELTDKNIPEKIIAIRNKITTADGIIICTPEYIFSIPSGLKNLIEWCVSTTVFSKKPVGLITASSKGTKAHEELKLIMKTIQTIFTNETTLLIDGLKGKIDKNGVIINETTKDNLLKFKDSFKDLIKTEV